MSDKPTESEQSLFIAVFDTEDGAETVYNVLLNMQNADMVQLKSASIVYRNKRGKLKVHHRFGFNRWTGAAGGVAIGFLLGGPLLGGAIGALVGSRGKGEERPAKEFLDDKLSEDQSAIIVVFEDADWEAVNAMFARYNADILKLELSAEAEQALTDAATDDAVAQAVHAEVDIETTE